MLEEGPGSGRGFPGTNSERCHRKYVKRGGIPINFRLNSKRRRPRKGIISFNLNKSRIGTVLDGITYGRGKILDRPLEGATIDRQRSVPAQKHRQRPDIQAVATTLYSTDLICCQSCSLRLLDFLLDSLFRSAFAIAHVMP